MLVEQCSRAPGWLFDLGDEILPNYMEEFMFSQLSSVQFTLEVKGIRLDVRRKLSNDHPGVTCEQ